MIGNAQTNRKRQTALPGCGEVDYQRFEKTQISRMLEYADESQLKTIKALIAGYLGLS